MGYDNGRAFTRLTNEDGRPFIGLSAVANALVASNGKRIWAAIGYADALTLDLPDHVRSNYYDRQTRRKKGLAIDVAILGKVGMMGLPESSPTKALTEKRVQSDAIDQLFPEKPHNKEIRSFIEVTASAILSIEK